MSWLIFFLLLNAVIFVFGIARHAIRSAAFPLTLLVLLAITGGLGNIHVHSDGVLWRYVPGPVAFGLAMWLAVEVYLRFSAPGARYQCRKCGYDLTGNTSGVCPECGRQINQ